MQALARSNPCLLGRCVVKAKLASKFVTCLCSCTSAHSPSAQPDDAASFGNLGAPYLTLLGASAYAEHLFSFAADSVTGKRGGLAAETIERNVSVAQGLRDGIKLDGEWGGSKTS